MAHFWKNTYLTFPYYYFSLESFSIPVNGNLLSTTSRQKSRQNGTFVLSQYIKKFLEQF